MTATSAIHPADVAIDLAFHIRAHRVGRARRSDGIAGYPTTSPLASG